MRVSREGHLGIPLSLSVIVATHLVLVNVVAFIPTNNAPLALLSPRPGGVDGGSSLFLMPPNNGGPPDMFVLGDDEDYGGEDEDEDEDDEEYVPDPYTTMASEEFLDQDGASSALTFSPNGELTTIEDWGGALGKLRERVDDVATGKSRDPSHALFRLMSSSTPNQVIGKFVQSANPQTVQAMTGAVSSLLGGLSNPAMGVDTTVKANGEKIGSLCFQLQMTGYLFRNAEYVLALKDLLKIRPRANWEEYKDAFERLDTDDSGFIDMSEIQSLFDSVYGTGMTPQLEIDTFLEFFDENKDGKIGWDEFEKGLGIVAQQGNDSATAILGRSLLLEEDDHDDEDDEILDINTDISGTLEIEMEDGKIVQVDAKDYIESLKAEARMLKDALRRENKGLPPSDGPADMIPGGPVRGGGPGNESMDIAQYISSRQGDVAALTEGISPEIVDTMKRLVKFVLEGGDSGKAQHDLSDEEMATMEMEIPGSALQQLALWQLVLGYRLREEEATGDYKNLLRS